MKNIVENLHYGAALTALLAFIILVLAVVMLRGTYQCLKRSK